MTSAIEASFGVNWPRDTVRGEFPTYAETWADMGHGLRLDGLVYFPTAPYTREVLLGEADAAWMNFYSGHGWTSGPHTRRLAELTAAVPHSHTFPRAAVELSLETCGPDLDPLTLTLVASEFEARAERLQAHVLSIFQDQGRSGTVRVEKLQWRVWESSVAGLAARLSGDLLTDEALAPWAQAADGAAR